MTRRRIDEISREIAVLREEIAVLEDEQHDLKADAAGIHIGDVVIVSRRAGESFEVLVDHVDTRWDKPWIHGRKRKKNGEWGSQSQRYFSDWKKVA